MYITSLSLWIVKVQKGSCPQLIFWYCKGYGPSKSEGQCPFSYPGTSKIYLQPFDINPTYRLLDLFKDPVTAASENANLKGSKLVTQKTTLF